MGYSGIEYGFRYRPFLSYIARYETFIHVRRLCNRTELGCLDNEANNTILFFVIESPFSIRVAISLLDYGYQSRQECEEWISQPGFIPDAFGGGTLSSPPQKKYPPPPIVLGFLVDC